MDIREAIASYRDKAGVCRRVAATCAEEVRGLTKIDSIMEISDEARVHAALAEEYEQIAQWLTELQLRRDNDRPGREGEQE